MLERLRARLRALIEQRTELLSQRQAIIDLADSEERSELTETETAEGRQITGQVRDLDSEVSEVTERIAELEAEAEATERAERAAAQFQADTPPVRVGDEARTYRPDAEHSLFGDMLASRNGDIGAQERLARHQQETRAIGTSAVAGLVPPAYLLDEFAELARAGRVFLNVQRSIPLPAVGNTLEISRLTTGTSVAAQASENTSVSETNADDTTLSVPVRTFAGRQTVSVQALDRSAVAVDQLIMGDLAADYAVQVDSSALNGDGSSGAHTGILQTSGITTVSYTDTTPTVAEFMPKLADAIQGVNSARYMPADSIFMHPRRWGWLISGVDSSNRPLIAVEAGGQNVFGSGDAAAVGRVGSLLGLPVYVDANIPTNLGTGTNEDAVIVTRSADHIIAESDLMELRIDEVTSLGVTMALYGYSAYSAGRYPASTAQITGTGLVTPTF